MGQLHSLYVLIAYSIFLWQKYVPSQGEPISGHHVYTANEKEFPFIVSLSLKEDNSDLDSDPASNHECGGSLITKNHVLTAAHCLFDRDLEDIQIVAAYSNLRSPHRETFDINSSITYEDWAEIHQLPVTGCDDMAILTLNAEDTNIRPVSSTTLSDSELVGKKVTLAGWGDSNKEESPSLLRKVSLTVLENSDCENRVSKLWNRRCKLAAGMVCIAANPWALGLDGDSGSPILDANNGIVGVLSSVSEGSSNPAECVNSVMRVSYYKNFIHSVTMSQGIF